MKKFIKINLIILIIFCISCNLVLIETNATSENVEENIEQNEENNPEPNENNSDENEELNEMDKLQIEKRNLESEIENSNKQIEFIESDLTATVLEISEINQKIYDKQMEIETLEAQEVEVLAYIEKAEEELEKSNKRYNSQKELLEKRLVNMYELGEMSYLDLLLSSRSLSEFLSMYYFIEQISKADNELLDTVEAEQKYNKKIKEALETKKLVLSASRETREKNAILLSNMSIIKNSKLRELSESELQLQQEIEEYQKQITEIETEIRLLAIANISKQYVGGTMAWPVPGYTRITSPFGMRTHPITGVYKLHTGVDIGAPMGSTFISANDGVVTYAGLNTAYGMMVIVDHGGGVTTLYAHGSEILVNVGDTVYQGTPVLKVGSTGYSTGPHAHFEVRINGEYVEPLDFITSYSSNSEENNNLTKNNDETKIELNEQQNADQTKDKND